MPLLVKNGKLATKDGKVFDTSAGKDCCCGGTTGPCLCDDCAGCADTYFLQWSDAQVTYTLDCDPCPGSPSGGTRTIVYRVTFSATIQRFPCNQPCGGDPDSLCCWRMSGLNAGDCSIHHEVEDTGACANGCCASESCDQDCNDWVGGGGAPGCEIDCQCISLGDQNTVLTINPGYPKNGLPLNCANLSVYADMVPLLSATFLNTACCPDQWNFGAIVANAVIGHAPIGSSPVGSNCTVVSVDIDPGTLVIS